MKRQRQKYSDGEGEEQEHKHNIDEGEGVHMTHCSWEEDRKQVIREKGETLKVKKIEVEVGPGGGDRYQLGALALLYLWL